MFFKLIVDAFVKYLEAHPEVLDSLVKALVDRLIEELKELGN